MSQFSSRYTNRVDKKGRVSVPAPFRAVLSASSLPGGVAVFPSLFRKSLTATSRDTLEEMSRRHQARILEQGDFERALLGGPEPDVLRTIFGMVTELMFDTEGRILLPADLRDEAGIVDEVTFVGRGANFEIWAAEAFRVEQAREIEALRARMAGGAGAAP